MKTKFRFHVVSLPHTQTTSEYIACAYTQKIIKFCKMMKSLGHEVFLYASEENEAPCDELIKIVSKKEQVEWFGDYDHETHMFNITWDANLECWQVPNSRAVKEIKKRAKPRDFVCLIAGTQWQVSNELPDMTAVEIGIGYSGTFAKYRVFESYA